MATSAPLSNAKAMMGFTFSHLDFREMFSFDIFSSSSILANISSVCSQFSAVISSIFCFASLNDNEIFTVLFTVILVSGGFGRVIAFI